MRVSQNINTPAGRDTTHRQSHPLIGQSQPFAIFDPSETAALFRICSKFASQVLTQQAAMSFPKKDVLKAMVESAKEYGICTDLPPALGLLDRISNLPVTTKGCEEIGLPHIDLTSFSHQQITAGTPTTRLWPCYRK